MFEGWPFRYRASQPQSVDYGPRFRARGAKSRDMRGFQGAKSTVSLGLRVLFPSWIGRFEMGWKRGSFMADSKRGWGIPGNAEPLRLVLRVPSSGASVPAIFHFHLVLFPAAYFLPGEEFSVIAAVARVAATGGRVVNLLSHPSLPRCNRRSAVGALLHILPLLNRKAVKRWRPYSIRCGFW